MKNSSLASQLIVFILTSAALIFLAASAYSYYASKEGIIRRARESAQHLTRETVYQIEVILRGVEKIPLNLAASLEHVPCERENLVGLVQTAMVHNKELFGVGVAFEPYAYNPQYHYFLPVFFPRRGWNQTAMAGRSDSLPVFLSGLVSDSPGTGTAQWSEPYFDEGAGNIIMSTFSVPFYLTTAGHRKLAGMVEADISLMWLQDIVSKVKIYQSGYAFLISQNGVFVTYPEQQLIMRESIFSIAEARGDPQMREVGRDMIRGGEGFVPIPAFAHRPKVVALLRPAAVHRLVSGSGFPG